jgi:hypothetical protein
MDELTQDTQSLEIVREAGGTWRVTIIKAGRSLNGNLYTAEVLKASSDKFEGRPLQAFDVAEGILGHLPVKVQTFLKGGLLKATVGVLRNVRWDDEADGLVAEAVITSPWLVKILAGISEAIKGPIRTFGLSISAAAETTRDDLGQAINAIRYVDSVDIVTTPAAGGAFTRALEALIQETEEMDEKKTDAPVIDVEAIKAAAAADADAKIKAVREELAAERKANMISRVVESVAANLNESTKTLIRKAVDDLEDEAAVRTAAQAYIDGLPQTKPIANLQTMRAPEDKLQAALNGLCGVAEGVEGEVPAFRGLRDAYMEWTGDRDLTRGIVHEGYVQEVSGQTSATPFTVGMGAALHRRLRKAYNQMDFGAMQLVSTVQAVNDFKSHNIIGIGGFADLSNVSEDAAYQPKTVPAEEYETLAVTKKGNLVTMTWESIVNDDLGITLRHTDRLGKAARRTLEKAIFALFTANSGIGATMTSGKQWFDSDDSHSNYGTTALGYAALLDAEAHIAAQTELTSSEPLGIEPVNGGFVIGARALRSTWLELTAGNLKPGTANNDGSALLWTPGQFVVNPFATDLTDWYMLADPKVYEAIIVAFLFGKQEPELLVADAATAYSMWNSDVIEYKIRHIWGLAIADYRSGYGSVVA